MKYLLYCLFCLIPYSVSSAACYIIYDSNGKVVCQSSTPPVDLSGSISQAVESKFHGSHLVINQSACTPSDGNSCELSEDKNKDKEKLTSHEVINKMVRQNPIYQNGGLSGYGSSDEDDSGSSSRRRSSKNPGSGSRGGCGSRGGPGWRRPDGKCASWDD